MKIPDTRLVALFFNEEILKNMKVLIDNGHGSNTKGKHSPDFRLREYAWARDIAKRIETKLLALGYDARRIVKEETDIPITTRVSRINAVCSQVGSNNVLLVSIHNNAAGGDGKWHDARGFSVFVSKNASTNSKKCASIFTEEAMTRKMMGNRSVPACKYWTWNWAKADIGILANSRCPAILTENFFQDNKEDVDYLVSENGKEEIVDLHVQAIIKYLKSL